MRRADEGPVRLRLNELPEHLLVGVSGGADSVALLLLLKERGGTIEAVHVNHGLRGRESDMDETFVEQLCEELGVPLRVYRAEPPAGVLLSEDWARQVRYGFFRQAMRESGADALALGHHQDDQAETLLLHLIRGSGLSGMSGIARDTTIDGMRVVRPLLGISGEALRGLLAVRRQRWRVDRTNTNPRFLRNAVRMEIMTRLEQYAPGASRRIAQAATLLREDDEALRFCAEAFLRQEGGKRWMAIPALKEQPAGLQRRILRGWWEELGMQPLDRRQTEDFLALVKAPAGTRQSMPGNWQAARGWTHLHLSPPQPEPMAEPTDARDGAVMNGIALIFDSPDGTTGDGRAAQLVPVGWADGVTLRAWQPGDWIRPYGMRGRKSMQDYFTDRHVDAPFRHRIPLICRDSEVLLACGVGAGDVPAMRTDEGVMLRWSGPMPWMTTTRKDEGT